MDEQTLKELGIRIRDLRTDAGMSQEQLCEAAGVDRAYISQIEGGTRNPSVSVVVRIADALGVTVSELLGEDASQSTGTSKSPQSGVLSEWAKTAEEDLNSTIKRLRDRGFIVSIDTSGEIRVSPPS